MNQHPIVRSLSAGSPISHASKASKAFGATLPRILVGKAVAIEGNIGAGKSTLSKKMCSVLPKYIDMYEEDPNQTLLGLFYNEPEKYAFTLQIDMLGKRKNQLAMLKHDISSKASIERKQKLHLWDRSMFGDYMFALANHLEGRINSKEMAVYESSFGGSYPNLDKLQFFHDVSCFVWLNDEPSQCKRRVEQERKHAAEEGIPLEYYELIDDVHFALFCRLIESGKAVRVLTWGQYESVSTTLDMIASRTTTNTDPIPSVKRANGLPHVDGDVVYYKDEEAILDAYRRYTLGKENNNVDKKVTVVINSDIMQITPEEKALDAEVASKYGLRFYKNEYKRLVAMYLSFGLKVVFYSNESN